jgi:pimeloyl-ACP methyl ester carboxylesterase
LTEPLSQILDLPDGRSLCFAEYGVPDGAPVMFAHSIPGSRILPEHTRAAAAEAGLRIIVPERPGFGLSDFQPGRTISDTTRDSVALADALGIDRFRVLGASAGCAYALAMCAAFPERVERAAIMSGVTPQDYAGPLHGAVPAPVRVVLQNVRSVSALLHRLLIFGMRKDPERGVQGLASQLPPQDKQVLARPDASRFIVSTSLECAHRGVRGMVYDAWLLNRPWDFSPRAIPDSVPVSFWWGSDDTGTPVEHGRALASQIPHSTLQAFEDCAHFGVVFDHLSDVLEDLRR